MVILKRLFLAGAAFFLFPALATEYPQTIPYPDHAKSTRTTVTVTIVWHKSWQELDAVCSYLTQVSMQGRIIGCYHSPDDTIHAMEPQSFNDHYRLEILGHEFWHALGATHQ